MITGPGPAWKRGLARNAEADPSRAPPLSSGPGRPGWDERHHIVRGPAKSQPTPDSSGRAFRGIKEARGVRVAGGSRRPLSTSAVMAGFRSKFPRGPFNISGRLSRLSRTAPYRPQGTGTESGASRVAPLHEGGGRSGQTFSGSRCLDGLPPSPPGSRAEPSSYRRKIDEDSLRRPHAGPAVTAWPAVLDPSQRHEGVARGHSMSIRHGLEGEEHRIPYRERVSENQDEGEKGAVPRRPQLVNDS
jgi:hypothetical protein